MGNDVFANGREISCKEADGKSICAFPDVCFTPPENPATPPGVPIPYPNTGMASDTTDGSKNVKISGKEVMLKNKSYFKKSTGDEAGCAAKKGAVTSTNTGKVYFNAWSMDVKFEGENVVRHMDLTTHNHASAPGQTPPWMHVDEMSTAVQAECKDEIDEAAKSCKDSTPENCTDDCRKAQKCLLVPKDKDKDRCCAPGNTGHHMIEDHWVKDNSNFAWYAGESGERKPYSAAPTVCVEGGRFEKEHGEMHNTQGLIEESFMPGGSNADKAWTYDEGKNAALIAHDMTFEDSKCSKGCLEAQLDDFYGDDGARPLNEPKTQSLAKTDKANDGRWLRSEAEEALAPLLGGA